jgi:hypothetical protein
MKRTAYRVMILAAAAVAAVTTVSAQNMKAEIPFPFQAVGARMQPGSYSIQFTNTGSTAVLSIYNQDTRKGILALPRVANSPTRPAYVNPVLTFACTDGHCVLSSLRNDQSTVYSFAGGKTSPGTRMATIALRSDRME